MPSKLGQAFNDDTFLSLARQAVEALGQYLKKATSASIPVLEAPEPVGLLKKIQTEFGSAAPTEASELFNQYLKNSIHLHHPGYLGHQVNPPLPVAAIGDFFASFLNSSGAVYEMSPLGSVIEKVLVRWASDHIGYPQQAEGFFTSGGTLGNLTCLLTARQLRAGWHVWTEGTRKGAPLAVLVSTQAHYSISRAVQIMGLGLSGMCPVPVDENYKMRAGALDVALEEAREQGKKVFAVVASAGSTATGIYDPLQEIADFCQKHNLWLHVDGAHGACAALSEKYKPLIAGIERADSIVWDAHKMLLSPSLSTFVLYRKGSDSYATFRQSANYLFEDSEEPEWFHLSKRTFECTKRNCALGLYTTLRVLGTQTLSDYVTRMYDLGRAFARLLEEQTDFEVAVAPESNILCYRYVPRDRRDLNSLQVSIRKKLNESGAFFLVQTELNGKIFLRSTLCNPLTTMEHLKALLDSIRGAT